MEISYSRESAYLRCPFSHYLSYVRKLTPKKPVRPLYFGSDFHKLLELRGDRKGLNRAIKEMRETYYDMPPKFQEELGENYIEDLKTIFIDYNKVYKNNPLPDVTEQAFEIKLGTFKGESVNFVGVIDGIYHIDGKTIIEEHKTFNRKPDLNTLTMNTQKCLYAKAIEKLCGKLPDHVLWDYIKSTPAKEPVWLEKSQRLSMAKSDYITPFSWERACKKHSVDEKLLKQGQDFYKDNTQNFFFRIYLDYTPEMVNRVWRDFVNVAKDICKRGETNRTMNITKDCSWCSFQPICYSILTGGNTAYIVETDYKLKEEREQRKEVLKA